MQKVSRGELAKIIAQKTLTQPKEQLVRGLATYITEQQDNINLDDLLRDVMYYRLRLGIVEATAVSAHELDSVVINDIEKILKAEYPNAKRVIINQKIDANLVGGLKLELPRETLDLSVRAKLNKFKQLIEEKQ
ncbi:MAG: F0F1 ATP synthase subunit delta [bacterium]|nr:F0F1 ATP synthase subunit delta [bacterium]